jgi:hypothetical protein
MRLQGRRRDCLARDATLAARSPYPFLLIDRQVQHHMPMDGLQSLDRGRGITGDGDCVACGGKRDDRDPGARALIRDAIAHHRRAILTRLDLMIFLGFPCRTTAGWPGPNNGQDSRSPTARRHGPCDRIQSSRDILAPEDSSSCFSLLEIAIESVDSLVR